MTRILLLVACHSYRASAFLEAARRIGADVVVGTDREQALSFVNPGGHLVVDFEDPVGASEAITAFARAIPLDAVIAADDDGAPIAALSCEALGLRHAPFAAVYAARSKLRLREAQRRAGMRTPWFRALSAHEPVSRTARELEYPCVIKPVHLAASRGVLRADRPEELVAAFERIVALLRRADTPRVWVHPWHETAEAAEGEILVEEYLPGVEVALEGLVSAGKLRVLALFDKPDPLVGPAFEETIYVTPSRLAPEARSAVTAEVAEGIAALGLAEGPVHAEARVNARGAWLVEIAPRSIGGLCSRTLRFGEGVSLEELLLRHALGLDASLELDGKASGVMMIPIPRAGALRAVRGQAEAAATPGIEELRIAIPVGQEIEPPPEGSRYLGFLFARGGSPAFVESALRKAHAALEIDIEPHEQRAPAERAAERAPAGGTTC